MLIGLLWKPAAVIVLVIALAFGISCVIGGSAWDTFVLGVTILDMVGGTDPRTR